MPVNEPRRGTLIILVTFFLALVLKLVPLGESFKYFRPEWVALFLIYWCLALPHRVGLITAWVLGLIIDTTDGRFLGQHAMALTILAYFVLSFYHRIRIRPVVQQALTIFVILFLYHLLISWFNIIILYKGLATEEPPGILAAMKPHLFAAAASALVWPVCHFFLRGLRRRYRID